MKILLERDDGGAVRMRLEATPMERAELAELYDYYGTRVCLAMAFEDYVHGNEFTLVRDRRFLDFNSPISIASLDAQGTLTGERWNLSPDQDLFEHLLETGQVVWQPENGPAIQAKAPDVASIGRISGP